MGFLIGIIVVLFVVFALASVAVALISTVLVLGIGAFLVFLAWWGITDASQGHYAALCFAALAWGVALKMTLATQKADEKNGVQKKA